MLPYLNFLTSGVGRLPYQFGPMRIPECNHKVTGNSYEAVDGCEAVDKWPCKAKISTKGKNQPVPELQ